MPLLDHFHGTFSLDWPWEGFHHAWAVALVQQLNHGVLPPRYYALPHIKLGIQVEVDVGGYRKPEEVEESAPEAGTTVWAPPRPRLTTTVEFAEGDLIEVRVLRRLGGPQLCASIELVSPANKDRPVHRRAFTVKCASYLQRGVSVVILDIVTQRTPNLHAELMALLNPRRKRAWKSPTNLFAASYRCTLSRTGKPRLGVWAEPLKLGAELPTVPLWLEVDLSVPLRLEESYQAACETLLIPPGGAAEGGPNGTHRS